MKYWQGEISYNFTWTQVVQGFWSRYPNPQSLHVLTEDMLETRIEGNKLYVKKIITKKGKIPSYFEKFTGGVSNIHLIEESIVDTVSGTLTTYTRNIELQNVMSVCEKCTYRETSTRDATLCRREVTANSNVPHFGRFIANYSIQQYKKNIESTRCGFLHALNAKFRPETRCEFSTEKFLVKRTNYLIKLLRTIHSKVKHMIFQNRHMRLVCCRTDYWHFPYSHIYDFLV